MLKKTMRAFFMFLLISGLIFVIGCENRDPSPSQLTLEADPYIVLSNGSGNSVYSNISAYLRNGDGEPVANERIVFTASAGNIDYDDDTNNDGIATVQFSGYQVQVDTRAIITGKWEKDTSISDTTSVYISSSEITQ